MPNIKLRDGSGVETTYNHVFSISVPLADGSGLYTFGMDKQARTITASSHYDAPAYRQIYGSDIPIYGQANLQNIHPAGVSSTTYTEGELDLSNVIIEYSPIQFINLYGGVVKLPPVQPGIKLSRLNAMAADDEGMQAWLAQGYTSTSMTFSLLPGLKKLDFSQWFEGQRSDIVNYTQLGYWCNSLAEVLNLPVSTRVFTGNQFTSAFVQCGMLRRFTFETDSGTPKIASWKNQLIDLTQLYFSNSTSSYSTIFKVNEEYPTSCRITGWLDYQNLTNEQKKNWWTTEQIPLSTDAIPNPSGSGTLTQWWPIQHYSHLSAVETINSLPDTSAYLNTSGGTNTLKLKKNGGYYNPEGGMNDLTEEEIAVAVAKGWTVSFA